MRARGIDASDLFVRRKQYLIDKWATVAPISNGPLDEIRRMGMLI